MKHITPSDIDALANQLERTARILRAKGREAVRRANDWATPLRSAGTNPGRSKGRITDPTSTAALSNDLNAEQLTLLSSEAGRCFDAATTLESRIMQIAADALIDNQRAGIGPCADCGDYMDGTTNRRLRLGLCEPCYRRAQRKTDQECAHMRTKWHAGITTCMGCGVQLTDAGRPA